MIAFIVLELAIIICFTLSLKKKLKKQGLLDESETNYWKCGCCYVNEEVSKSTLPHS